jgi:demethoxyubiquinone hydroxylase (CLK1/Coq7/Cat5 family)
MCSRAASLTHTLRVWHLRDRQTFNLRRVETTSVIAWQQRSLCSAAATTPTSASSSSSAPLGERHPLVDEIIRVDLAGELAAKHIYQSQLAVHRGTASSRAQLQVMLAHELEHLRYFEESLPGARARPSLLNPLWQGLASALGTVSGLAGEKAAFLTTAAVEEVIVEHYTR